MKEIHIAFITLPHSPHVYPTLPIVSSLVRRGYRVTYVTSQRFSSAVEIAGAELVPCERLEAQGSLEEFNRENEPHEDALVHYTTRMLEHITPFFERNRPDLIVYDFMAFAGRILAKRWGIPAIQTSPFYALHGDDLKSQIRHDEFRNSLIDHAGIMTPFLRLNGVASDNYRADKEKLNIYLFPRVLQPNSSLFGDSCFYAGRCAAERQPQGQWQDNSEGRPIALVSMSTIFAMSTTAVRVPEYFGICIAVLSDLGWHVSLSVGEHCDAESLLPLPHHCEIIQHTSYLKVLSRASLLVFMSGIISTTEAAYHGVPMIAISNGIGEFEWQSDRIAELGIGIHLTKTDVNPENLRRAAIRLSEDAATLLKVKEVQRMVKRESGGEDTTNRIEEYFGVF